MGNIVGVGINNPIIIMILIAYSFPIHEYFPKRLLPVDPHHLSRYRFR